MRRPTDRALAWDHWRRRLNGERLEITSQPQCGWYRAKRRGQWVAVQIDLQQEIDPETGDLITDERPIAFIGDDVFYDAARVGEIWLHCAAHPITEAEAERLLRMPAVRDLSRQVVT